MFEIVLSCVACCLILFSLFFIICCVIRDHKISKEWERIFKKGGRDD